MKKLPIATLLCDCYKSGHIFQYPEGTEELFLNFTPRSATYFPGGTDEVAIFGIQAFVQEWLIDYWNDNFFNRPLEEVMEEHAEYMDGVLGKGTLTHDHIRALKNLGYLPLEVRALPEGTISPVKVPVLTVRSTHPEFAWVAGYLEDMFSNNLWKSITIATIAMKYRELGEYYAELTGSPIEFVDYQFHDFALRGMSGMWDDAFHNMAHLAFFKGTDSFPATYAVKQFYGEGVSVSDIAASIPATEHSVTCANIAKNLLSTEVENNSDAEVAFLNRLLTEVYPSGMFSAVGDTNDWFDTVTNKAEQLKDVILSRDGKIVFRPDSGDPIHILCGYKVVTEEEALTALDEYFAKEGYTQNKELSDESRIRENRHIIAHQLSADFVALYGFCQDSEKEAVYNLHNNEVEYHSTAMLEGAVQSLWNTFGGTLSSEGYKILDPHVGIIYGDSITLERAKEILKCLAAKGFASCNVVFGVGSFTYQYLTRDSLSFAIKATAAVVNGYTLFLAKDPITDNGTKKSATGYLSVGEEPTGRLFLRQGMSRDDYLKAKDTVDVMECVFLNGHRYASKKNILDIRSDFQQNMK